MIRIIGLILGLLSGLLLLSSFLRLTYLAFWGNEEDEFSRCFYYSYGESMALLFGISLLSLLVFYFVYRTGFGKSELELVQEELNILKIRNEINKLKNSRKDEL